MALTKTAACSERLLAWPPPAASRLLLRWLKVGAPPLRSMPVCRKEDDMPRVALDQPAPDFSLLDYRGCPVSLSDFRGKKNVLLVFNRGFM